MRSPSVSSAGQRFPLVRNSWLRRWAVCRRVPALLYRFRYSLSSSASSALRASSARGAGTGVRMPGFLDTPGRRWRQPGRARGRTSCATRAKTRARAEKGRPSERDNLHQVEEIEGSDEDAPDNAGYQPFPDFEGWLGEGYDDKSLQRYFRLLETTRREAGPAALELAVRTATRYAAVDTGAIEGLYEVDRGFTRTIAVEAAAWEAALQARGTEVRRAIEDALHAYEFVLDAATASVAISESWIRQLHEIICASQDTYTVFTSSEPQERPLIKGRYKTEPNSPLNISTGRVHQYAPVIDTTPEMQRLVGQMRTEEFIAAPSVVQAAYAHYAFACIHPFPDGNGRVARALASIFLYRLPGVPLVVFADQRADYLDVLEAADEGNPLRLVTFVEQRVVDAIEIVRAHVRTEEYPHVDTSLARMRSVLVGRGGLSHLEFDAAAERLLAMVLEEYQKQLSAISLPEGVQTNQSYTGHTLEPPSGYRRVIASPRTLSISLSSGPPSQSVMLAQVSVFPALPDNTDADFILTCTSMLATLQVQLRDIHPVATEVLRLKITGWVESLLDTSMAVFTEKVAQALRQAGYIE